MEIHISFVAEELFKIGNISVTNSLFTFVLITFLLIIGISLLRLSLNPLNPSRAEILIEIMYSALKSLANDILGHNANKFFAFLCTFFILILFSNWFGLLPIVPSVGFVHEGAHATDLVSKVSADTEASNDEGDVHTTVDNNEEEHSDPKDAEEHKSEVKHGDAGCLISGRCLLSLKDGIVEGQSFTPVFRAPSADLSFAVALAIISVVVTNAAGLQAHGPAFLKRYFDFRGPIEGFVGIFELVSEFAKIISFGFRLFGNIFAGEVLLTVITAISMGIATLPIIGLELFVGIIQALVFFLLTGVFINLATEHH